MARPKGSFGTPGYCRHKPSNRGYATFNGATIYFPGDYGTKVSRAAYDRLLGEYLANGRRLPGSTPLNQITITELIAAYWAHCVPYYSVGEAGNIKQALRPLNKKYGDTTAESFGPLALKSVQRVMVELGWSRGVVNKQIIRIRQMFKWGVANEMVAVGVYEALRTLTGLREGRTDAPEMEPVMPVPLAEVNATIKEVSPIIRDMINLQLLTGARPGEICAMKDEKIERKGAVWIYTPKKHKTAHRGHTREIRIGPKAQKIVVKYLKPDHAGYLFSPADAERDRLARLRKLRKTPVQPSQVRRAAAAKRRKRIRPIGTRYTVSAYRLAIWRGCDKVHPPPAPLAKREDETLEQWKARLTAKQREDLRQWRSDHRWHPHQLRHSFATDVRRKHGIEMVKIILGHRSVAATEIYAEADVKKATRIMGSIG